MWIGVLCADPALARQGDRDGAEGLPARLAAAAAAAGVPAQVDTLDLRPRPGVILKQCTARDVCSRWDVVEAHPKATARVATGFLTTLELPAVTRARHAWEHISNTVHPRQALGSLTPQQFLRQPRGRRGEAECH